MTDELAVAVARSAVALEGAESILLCAHVNPDGDALGSMLAAFWALRELGKDPVATFPAPFRTAETAHPHEPDEDQVDRDDIVEEPRHDQDQDACSQSDDSRQMPSSDGH